MLGLQGDNSGRAEFSSLPASRRQAWGSGVRSRSPALATTAAVLLPGGPRPGSGGCLPYLGGHALLNLPMLVTPRCFKLTCRAVGVHPPLELSHYQVKFAATALYDTSVATLYVVNPHLSINALTHSVPRVGSGDICPVGPTSFEFLLPPGSPITISPSVGTVLPGKVGAGPTGAGATAGMGSALPS